MIIVILSITFIALLIALKILGTLDSIQNLVIEQKLLLSNLDSFFNKQITFLYNSITKQIENNILKGQDNVDLMQKQIIQISKLDETKINTIKEFMMDINIKMQDKIRNELQVMKSLVEEKLQSTLGKRLGESFHSVNRQLEMVYKGLGEMKSLAVGVGDLKKVLTNVKTRGIWGEMQLGNILKQVLSKEQYVENAKIDPLSNQRVEYALKLPNKDTKESITLLPIDAKIPMTEYHKLIDCYAEGEKNNISDQIKILERVIKKEAQNISTKYIKPPYSTDFAIMFLPVEGLYAEIVKINGLVEQLQQKYRIVITSPTTLIALLNSVQIGYKTFGIEKRSSEIWELLSIVKYEFSNFISLLSKTKTKLDQASKEMSSVEYKGNIIKNKLQNAKDLPFGNNKN